MATDPRMTRQRVRRRRPSTPPPPKWRTQLAMLWPRDRTGWIASAIVAGVLGWYLLYLLAGDGTRWLGYLNAGGFWWGLIALIAGVVLAAKRLWVPAATAVLLGLIVLFQGVAFGGVAGAAVRGPSVRLASASLRALNTDMESAARTLLGTEAQVLVVQEAHVPELIAALDRQSGQGWNHAELGTQVIACRCRIAASHTDGGILSADLALPFGTTRVWDVRAPKAYNEVLLNETYIEALSEQMATTPGIAAGDFNATPWNDAYATISTVARDGWREGGVGAGFTFPTRYRRMGMLMPLIQIDHVFVGGDLTVTAMHVAGASDEADHFPLVAEIARRAG